MDPLYAEVPEESGTNKKHFFLMYLLFLSTGVYYKTVHTKRTASVIMQRHNFIRQPSLFTSRSLAFPTELRRAVKNDF
jgi:hypothetical protein